MTISTSVKDYLNQHGVKYKLLAHAATTDSRDTAVEARIPSNKLAKAVIVRTGENYIMVVVPSNEHVDLAKLNRLFAEEPVDLASEVELHRLLPDCAPGAVPAIGPAWKIDTYLDLSLLGLSEVFFEAGDHIELVQLTGNDFELLLKNAEHGHYGHTV